MPVRGQYTFLLRPAIDDSPKVCPGILELFQLSVQVYEIRSRRLLYTPVVPSSNEKSLAFLQYLNFPVLSYFDQVSYTIYQTVFSLDTTGTIHNSSMNPTVTASSSQMMPTNGSSPVNCHHAHHSNTNHFSWSSSKTSYQLAHPAIHARHKWLKLRPQTLLQLQQASQTPRPLPVLDVLPSAGFIPLVSRSIPQMFWCWHGLGPNDLVVVRSELCDQRASDLFEKSVHLGSKGRDQREVVATICQPPQKETRSQGKAKVFLTLGIFCEATPLSGGSYEFLVHSKNGVQIMRWALRRSKKRRMPTSNSQPREESKRFTFSVIDPSSRRHPVIASLTRNHLEVYHGYSPSHRSCSPNSGMSEFDNRSEIESLDSHAVIVDDRLRILIIVTGIWVAFREGWSLHFRYRDPVAVSHTKVSKLNNNDK